jgi:hypothetical protein
MADYLRELAANYDIAGLWFDGLENVAGHCYCSFCRDGFRREYGLELPTDRLKEWPTWLKWKDHCRATTRTMIEEWHAAVDQVKPGLPFLANTWWDNSSETVPGAVASHEVLWRDDTAYDYLGVLDYNLHPVVPHAGSAIFLHVWHPTSTVTQGCVALKAHDLTPMLSYITTLVVQ